jgi:2-succinyl-6-hydroxy-2,4-cyclohexadiene-1-carboxylate synthase
MLVGLHGFGNTPRIFDAFHKGLIDHAPTVQFFAPDLYKDPLFAPISDFELWVEQFVAYLKLQVSEPVWLIGYSMGGRLALHALMKHPELFFGGILLSASPGCRTPNERSQRQLFDQEWSERFRSDPWDDVQKKWSELPVFQGTSPLKLRQDVDRESLAQSLLRWSQSRHLFSVAELGQLKRPTSWLSGRRDSKYVELHQKLMGEVPNAMVRVCESAGHRLLEDAPMYIVDEVLRFIKERS